ncbi:hypothetical protein [Micromonospora sp. NPDC051296]|uniref:hypothetical protein n=1 Tax=Micromonospora sp. NPDC051296 TaxID=3155046 RepID=UPI003432A7C5
MLPAAHACLCGIVHAVIVAVEASVRTRLRAHRPRPILRVRRCRSLQADITIPVAFDIAASGSTDIGSDTRRAVRDRVHGGTLLERCVRDIRSLLLSPGPSGPIDGEWLDEESEIDALRLWDEDGYELASGRNYGEEVDF